MIIQIIKLYQLTNSWLYTLPQIIISDRFPSKIAVYIWSNDVIACSWFRFRSQFVRHVKKESLQRSFRQNDRLKRRILRAAENDKSPQFHELSSARLTGQFWKRFAPTIVHRRKHQLDNDREKSGRGLGGITPRIGLFTCWKRRRFRQTRSSIPREKRKPRYATPKRFSLIDFEGSPVVNSTGMHRNATLLNSSAMESLRSLSTPPTPSPPPPRTSYHPCPAVYTSHYRALAPFPVPSIPFSYAVSSGLSHFRSRPCRDVVQYLHTDR